MCKLKWIIVAIVSIVAFIWGPRMAFSAPPLYEADEVLQFIDLNVGESFRFRLINGEERVVSVQAQRLVVLETYDYGVEVDILVDGYPLKLKRWFATNKQFTPPEVVNGMRIALEIASAGDGRFYDESGNEREKISYWYRLEKDVRLLVNDMRVPLWPEVQPIWDDEDLKITDEFMIGTTRSTFFGLRPGSIQVSGRIHTDVDINFPVGTPNYAPFAGTVAPDPFMMGDRNDYVNIRFFSQPMGRDGKVYHMRYIHNASTVKSVGDTFQAGELIFYSGDVSTGPEPHTHFMLIEDSDLGAGAPYTDEQMFSYDGDGGPNINPWWLIWQGFENEKIRRQWTYAKMEPLSPAKVAQEVSFSSTGSTAAPGAEPLTYLWGFGDGQSSTVSNPTHVYDASEIYLVTLTVTDTNSETDSFQQYITVDGPIPQGDVTGDGTVDILDLQACVNVFLGTETRPDFVQRAKEVAEPYDECNVLDVQAIVNIILRN